MAYTHVVKQGEDLTDIAVKYKFSDWKDIYNHSKNKKFQMRRPDPDVIMPGDKLYIPDVEKKKVSVSTGKTHRFVVKSPGQQFRIKFDLHEDLFREKLRAVLNIGSKTIEASVRDDGLIEMDVNNTAAGEGRLDIYVGPDSEFPDYTFTIGLSHLDPVDEITGLQARLNALDFDCGEVDGNMDSLTSKAVREFQTEYKLKVDGIAGASTRDALIKAYGC